MKDSDFKQLRIVYKEHSMVWSYCPLHNDTVRPNLSISLLDKYYGRYKCWACSAEGYLTKEQMSELNLSCSIAYKNSEKNLLTRWKQFNESCYDNLQKFPSLKLGLAKQLNISTKSLDDWLIGYDGESFTIPMFRDDLIEYRLQKGICGIHRRFSDSSKACIAGSRLGLMYSQKLIGDYYTFICEGFSDAVSIWDLGLQSIARPYCYYMDGIEEFFNSVQDMTIEQIIIVPDNNAVGMGSAEKLQDKLSRLYYYDEEACWEVRCDVSMFSFTGAKDIREYIAKRGKSVVKKELLRAI